MSVASFGGSKFLGKVVCGSGGWSNLRYGHRHMIVIRRFVGSLDHRILPFRQIMRQISMGPHVLWKEVEGSYEDAVMTLNTLQSNAAYLEKTKAERDRKRHLSLPQTIETAKRVGITLDNIDDLAVIHISGTKGKGSTCAFAESILRNHGYRTGFFSSPHLVEVRERVRINGKPLKKDLFSSYFWACYKQLDASKDRYNGDMPTYFRFLTVMAYYVFIKEKVDVAIIEVGIGGEYDCTNIVRNPVVCGVTSLGIDHTSILGKTLDQIAWHKAGIFKPGVPAVTVPQPDNSIQVLVDRAHEKGCPLYLAPESAYDYDWTEDKDELGIPGAKQCTNASLAIQLCDIWLKDHKKDITDRKKQYSSYVNKLLTKAEFLQQAERLTLNESTVQGLIHCFWPGRCQVLSRPGVTYYLDGAHTPRSLEVCAQWYKDVSHRERKLKSGRVVSILLFNTTGDRQPASLLEHLLDCDIDVAVFCPNIASTPDLSKADQTNYMVTNEMQLKRCRENQTAWFDLLKVASHPTDATRQTSNQFANENIHSSSDKMHNYNDNDLSDDNNRSSVHTELFSSILEALHWITQGKDPSLPQLIINVASSTLLQKADHIQVLCTGSLHLVGGILSLLEPHISDK